VTEKGLVCAEDGCGAFERAACGYFEPRTDVVEGTHVDAPPAPRSPPHPFRTWKTVSHDLEAVMEVFVAGSERPVIRRNSEEPYGLACREGSEGPDEFKVYDWDDILRLMLMVDSGDHVDAWEHNGVSFLLGFHRGAGRRRPTKSARPSVTETLEDEEAWFSRRGTSTPTLEFLKRLLA
jgi:hypothetical protein